MQFKAFINQIYSSIFWYAIALALLEHSILQPYLHFRHPYLCIHFRQPYLGIHSIQPSLGIHSLQPYLSIYSIQLQPLFEYSLYLYRTAGHSAILL